MYASSTTQDENRPPTDANEDRHELVPSTTSGVVHFTVLPGFCRRYTADREARSSRHIDEILDGGTPSTRSYRRQSAHTQLP